MAYEIRFSDVAVEQLKKLRAFDRTAIQDEVDEVLGTNPTLESKAKIKLLRQPAPTQYRLRVADFRVFYDVEGENVNVIQVLTKQDAIAYLEEKS